jgi:hypothetical protein
VLVGFEASEGATSDRSRPSPPDLRGIVAAGVGDDGRYSGRLRLALLSPPWCGAWRAVLDVDANVLTARDTGELFYLYDLGIERAAARWTWGGYFHHRSNHVLAEPNPEGITSRDVLEAGAETDRWGAAPRPRSFDLRVRAGGLLDSSFGASTRLNLRAGARVAGPSIGRWTPWVVADIEEGDADALRGAVGATSDGGVELRVDYRNEAQFFGSDHTAWTVGAAQRF